MRSGIYLPEATSADLLRLSESSILMGAASQNKAAARMYAGRQNSPRLRYKVHRQIAASSHTLRLESMRCHPSPQHSRTL